VKAVVGQPERSLSLTPAWRFSEPAIREAARLTVFLSTAMAL